jgi:hypothetical protein
MLDEKIGDLDSNSDSISYKLGDFPFRRCSLFSGLDYFLKIRSKRGFISWSLLAPPASSSRLGINAVPQIPHPENKNHSPYITELW